MRLIAAAWSAVKGALHFVGRIVTVILLTVIYLALLTPLGALLVLLRKAPLQTRRHGGSTWSAREGTEPTLQDATRPF